MKSLKLILIGLGLSWSTTVQAYEEPRYEVLKSYEYFEVREYQPYLMAMTEVEGNFKSAGNKAFKILAEYIFGNNRSKQTLSQTTLGQRNQTQGNEKIAMTTPVAQTPLTAEQERYQVSFMMPVEYTRETLPEPVDTRVQIHMVPKQTVAVLRYSGTWSKRRYQTREAWLLSELKKQDIQVTGKAVFARFNPPITPWFLRRNEVQIPIAFNEAG